MTHGSFSSSLHSCTVVLCLAVGALLAGCDLLNEPVSSTTEEKAAPLLFAEEDSENDGPWLHISAQIPSLACRVGEDLVDDFPTVDDPERVVTARSSQIFGASDEAYVFDNKQENVRQYSKDGQLRSPNWYDKRKDHPDFNSGEDKMVIIEGKINVGLIGSNESEKGSISLPKGTSFEIDFVNPLGSPKSRVLEKELKVSKKSLFGSHSFKVVFAYDENVVSRTPGTQAAPSFGRLKLKTSIPKNEEFDLKKEINSVSEKIRYLSVEENSEKMELEMQTERQYVMSETVPEIYNTKVNNSFETLSLIGLGLGLTASAIPAAAMAMTVGGPQGAALFLLAAQIDFLPQIAGTVVEGFPGGGGSGAASAAMVGTGAFIPEESENENIPTCPTDGGDPSIPLSGDIEGNYIPSTSGPLLNVEDAPPPPLRSRPAGRRIAYGETKWANAPAGSNTSKGAKSNEVGSMVAFSGDTGERVGFDPVTEVRRLDGSSSSGGGNASAVKSSMMDNSLTDVGYSSVAWGQIDGSSGSPDLVVSGFKAGGFEPSTRLYENNGGNFEPAGAGLIDVGQGDVSWADFNDDGRQDILVSGFQERESGATDPVTKLYRNTEDGFEHVGAGLLGVGAGEAAWADYDGDGDLDLILTGRDDNREPVTQLYENTADGFTPRSSPLPDVDLSSVAWGDYDGDGSPDLVIAGRTADGSSLVELYHNDDGSLSLAYDSPIGVERGDLDWADYDSDGDLDLALAGLSVENDSPVTALVENTSSSGSSIFGDVKFFGGASLSSVDWGDMGNDGAPDLIVSGLGSAEDNESDYKSPKTVVLENKEE